MGAKIMAAWRWLPVLIRAPVIAFIVAFIGNTAGVLPLAGNLKFHPEIPWALPATLIVMAIFWYYFTGGGYPAATQAIRRQVTRDEFVSARTWRAVILPLIFSVVAISSLRLALPSVLPVDAPKFALDVTHYPFATVVGLLLALAVSAGIAEEVAFRGYLQKPLEDAYGIVPALFITGIAFWYAHSDKVALSHLPFHMAASITLGLAAYYTRSLLPAIIGHAAGDTLLQPAYVYHEPAFIWQALTAKPLWETHGDTTLGEKARVVWRALELSNLTAPGPAHQFAVLAWVFVASSILTTIAFVGLARTARAEREKA
jgi:membrane protease YdiL (CAAX protease family)